MALRSFSVLPSSPAIRRSRPRRTPTPQMFRRPSDGRRTLTFGVVAQIVAMIVIVAWYAVGLPGGFARVVVGDFLFTGLSLTTALLCWWTGSRLGPQGGRPWRWLAASYGCWCAGQLVWDGYELWRRTPVPYPSLADVGYLGYFPLVIIALVLLFHQETSRKRSMATVLDGSIITVAAGGLLFEFMLAPIHEVQGSGTALAASVLWQAGMILVIFVAGSVIHGGSPLLRWRPAQLIIGSLLLNAATNIAYGRLALEGTYAIGHWMDLGWHVSFLMVGIAAVLAS